MGLGGLSYPNECHLKKIKNKKKSQMVGLVESHTILHMILPFCDPVTILNFLVRWNHKIVRFYDSDRDFDNHVWDQVKMAS